MLVSLMPLLFLTLCGLLAAYVVITQLIIPMLSGRKIIPILKDTPNLYGIYGDGEPEEVNVITAVNEDATELPTQQPPVVKKRYYKRNVNKNGNKKKTDAVKNPVAPSENKSKIKTEKNTQTNVSRKTNRSKKTNKSVK